MLDRIKKPSRTRGDSRAVGPGLPGQRFAGAFHNIEHHLAHLSSAFHVSPFEEAVVVSIDGFGDFSSAAWGVGSGSDLFAEGRVYFPAFARHLLSGADPVSRVSALRRRIQSHGPRALRQAHPHGRHAQDRASDARWVVQARSRLFSSITGPRCRINGRTVRPSLGIFSHQRWKSFWVRAASPPIRSRIGIATSHARCRRCTRRHSFILIGSAQRKYGLTDLALAGGCAMNSVANGKVRRMTPFRRVYVQAAAGDAGGAIGAAFAVWHKLGGERSFVMDHAYWGPQFSSSDIQTLFRNASIRDRRGRLLSREHCG